ncbi:hypothetical protein [Microcoleus sp. Pol12B4]|uniref:hypothetical protein n=1 Tax=Microcoleus sp. Pol12B4 TaxID=3055395 RepID=UPI002FD5A3A0
MLQLVGWNNSLHLAISMTNPIQQEARQILDSLAFTPCDRCYPLSHDLDTIPARVSLYAFRHRIQGLLYIGKAKNRSDRLRGGQSLPLGLAQSLRSR